MKKISKILLGGLIVIGFSACTIGFEEANTNPNRITVGDVKARSMFEPLLYNGVNNWQNYAWYWSNELIQFTAFTGGGTREEHRYKISDVNWQSIWNNYTGYANNAIHMYDLSIEQNEKALEAMALTFKVLQMYNLTDMYGDIPYSEAFQAIKAGKIIKPKFDSQKDVYLQMFAELEAANDIYATNPIFEKTGLDGMYKGRIENWRKFNNSLYLRLLCRISGRSEMNAGAKMTEIINNPTKYPIFTSNADNATVTFTGSAPYRNEFADTNEGNFTSSGRKLTKQLINMTVITQLGKQVYQDPRLNIYGKINTSKDNNPDSIWIGTVAGCTVNEQNTVDKGTSWLNAKVFCRADAPGTYMDYAEIQFIFAEAALKGYIAGGEAKAKEYYEAAVTASIEKWSLQGKFSVPAVVITPADISTFLASDLASWDKATNKAELIANQKFLALFWIGMEAYHEYRRTGYPVLTIGNGATYNNDAGGNKILPTRFAYPNTTMATNNANATEALVRMGGDNTMRTPVWWSKQAIEGN